MSGLKSRLAVCAAGKSILTDCRRIMLRLASMNEASTKNMMSISGMISMRAFLCGNGEPILIEHTADCLRAYRTTRRQDNKTPGPQDNKTTGQRDHGTT